MYLSAQTQPNICGCVWFISLVCAVWARATELLQQHVINICTDRGVVGIRGVSALNLSLYIYFILFWVGGWEVILILHLRWVQFQKYQHALDRVRWKGNGNKYVLIDLKSDFSAFCLFKLANPSWGASWNELQNSECYSEVNF